MWLSYILIKAWLNLVSIQITQWDFNNALKARLDDALIQTTL